MAGEKVNNEIKRINLIDPNDFTNQYAGNSFSDNKFNMSIPPEDLSIVVELTTYAKGRSILISSTDNSTTTVTNKKINVKFNKNELINLMTYSNDATTGNQPNLTTKYTDLSTQLDTIDEALGLTSIDIDFNSSYTPMVNMSFIDVRGGAIFQQGGSSKYSVFFRLPYPLFQLKIKGFYGKPVVYCLHLTKFSSKFNSQTGNFEITTNFVGYTYALLADMGIGYLKAAGETKRGAELLAARNVMPINTLLQNISKIDESIKSQLSINNADATTLSLYQKGEAAINNLIDTVLKYSANLQQLYGNKNLLRSSANNKDIVIIDINSSTDIRDELFSNVNDFYAAFQQLVKSYNSITTNTNLNLIPNLGPIFTEINPNQLNQPIASDVRTGLQQAYKRYALSDENQINNLVKRLHDAIESKNNDLMAFVDFTDCFSVLNAQLENITTQEKNVEISLGKQLFDRIKAILGFDPNIRNITNIFTTHIEVLLQLIFETAQKQHDATRISALSKFKGTNSLDISKVAYENDDIFPWPEYQEKGEEAYLGKPGVLTNPEQVPELQLVDDLYNGMIRSQEIVNNLDAVVANGATAWASANPIDSIKYQQIKPYDRLLTSTGPNDLASYVVMRLTSYMGFSNTFLTTDEIKAFATTEAQSLVGKFSSNFNIINGLLNNYKTPTDYLNASSTLGGTNALKSYVLRPSPENQNGYRYTYIDEKTTNRYIIPTDTNFYGPKAVYKLSKTTAEPSKYLLSSRICDTSDLRSVIDFAYYVDIIEKSDYETPAVAPATNFTSSALNVQNLLSTPTGDVSNWLKSCNFNTSFGKYGIQDFITANYSNTGSQTGLSGEKSFYSLFYDNANNTTPNLTAGRITQFIPDYDLYDIQGAINNFQIISANATYLERVRGVFTTGNIKAKVGELFANQKNQGQNLLAFNNGSISFPFFGYSVNSSLGGQLNCLFQSLFGSRFYHAQEVHSKAYLFLHSFPWRGLVGIPDSPGIFNADLIKNIFQYRTGFVQVPKLFPAFIGALIWRYEKGNKKKDGSSSNTQLVFDDPAVNPRGKDPLIFTSNGQTLIFGDSPQKSYPKSHQYCTWINNSETDTQYGMKFFDIAKSYTEIEDIILNLPAPAKQIFLNEFYNFVNGTKDFANQGFDKIRQLFEIFPVSANGIVDVSQSDAAWVSSFNRIRTAETSDTNNVNNILANVSPNPNNPNASTTGLQIVGELKVNNFFTQNYQVFSYFSDFPNNYIIEYKQNSLLNDTLKVLFLDYKYLVNCSWRLWGPIFNPAKSISDCNASVYVNINDFNTYTSTFISEITKAKNANNTEKFNNKNSQEIKHEIYRTLKKIYDKWIANSDSPSKAIFQCCTTGGIMGTPTRLPSDALYNNSVIPGNTGPTNLINSFRFISRAFVDIGDKLPINPIALSKLLIDSTDNSFYDLFSRILTDNNLIFVPLPTYIDYSDPQAVESIFQAYPYYQASQIPTSGPSFVCMYVGQTSTKLDFQNNSDYPNDGMNLTDSSSVGDDLKSDLKNYETPTAAFIVRYGQQNQNIFKDIVLDQAEFTETFESLKITDAIANTYSQTSQSYVGQNLYNVYSARSYKAEVTMMGNAMIQPMMYFQLENIPMFRGAYLIIGVKHHLQPNSMSTTFTGVRIKKIATPLIDAPTLYTSVLQGYELPVGGPTTINTNYTNYVFKYQEILRQNLPANKTIERSATLKNFKVVQITSNSNTQIQNWGAGTLSENTAKGTKLIIDYSHKDRMYDFRQLIHSPSDPWSAVFVSYIMTFGDSEFPAATTHYDYVTKALDGKNGYEVFPLSSGLSIKAEVGDILILPRSGGYQASHGNIIYKIENNVAFLVGGNRGLISESTLPSAVNYSSIQSQKNDGTVKATQLTLTNGRITDATTVGSYLLIMKKTQKKYYDGKQFSTTASNPSPNDKTSFNLKLSTQQVQTNKVEVKDMLKSFFLKSFDETKSKVYTAAVMGNIQHESTFNETALAKDINGFNSYGLVQWNTQTYPNVISEAGNTINTQLNFLFTNDKFGTFIKQIKNLTPSDTTASYIAFVFAKYFEGCANCNKHTVYLADVQYHQAKRSTYATNFYNNFNTPNNPLTW